MWPPKIIWYNSCSVNTKKTNLLQLFLQWWRLQESNFNGTGIHQGHLFEKFKEKNLEKVNLKLQTQEKPPRMFLLAYNLPKTTSNF